MSSKEEDKITRRDFLKKAGIAAVGVAAVGVVAAGALSKSSPDVVAQTGVEPLPERSRIQGFHIQAEKNDTPEAIARRMLAQGHAVTPHDIIRSNGPDVGGRKIWIAPRRTAFNEPEDHWERKDAPQDWPGYKGDGKWHWLESYYRKDTTEGNLTTVEYLGAGNVDTRVHIARAGETIGGIAAEYGGRIEDVVVVNDLGGREIRPWDVLAVPTQPLP